VLEQDERIPDNTIDDIKRKGKKNREVRSLMGDSL
jgi:hypothetical protein